PPIYPNTVLIQMTQSNSFSCLPFLAEFGHSSHSSEPPNRCGRGDSSFREPSDRSRQLVAPFGRQPAEAACLGWRHADGPHNYGKFVKVKGELRVQDRPGLNLLAMKWPPPSIVPVMVCVPPEAVLSVRVTVSSLVPNRICTFQDWLPVAVVRPRVTES